MIMNAKCCLSWGLNSWCVAFLNPWRRILFIDTYSLPKPLRNCRASASDRAVVVKNQQYHRKYRSVSARNALSRSKCSSNMQIILLSVTVSAPEGCSRPGWGPSGRIFRKYSILQSCVPEELHALRRGYSPIMHLLAKFTSAKPKFYG